MKNRFVAAFFAFYFGVIGLNNFYTNNKGKGVTDVLVSVLLCWTILAPCVVAVINLVRGIEYIWCNSNEEFNEKFVDGFKANKTLLND